jgi:hypothetical protein
MWNFYIQGKRKLFQCCQAVLVTVSSITSPRPMAYEDSDEMLFEDGEFMDYE